ncbi:unnamed protein product [Leptidea sinapis]|uniref:Uncharacterized protein n=1 Tax=Leptidea sinapis TaxID=189913 RepID=A0A5E4QKT2_9NEOP|nr:unnamed protein product [Leptidea sinapis]
MLDTAKLRIVLDGKLQSVGGRVVDLLWPPRTPDAPSTCDSKLPEVKHGRRSSTTISAPQDCRRTELYRRHH